MGDWLLRAGLVTMMFFGGEVKASEFVGFPIKNFYAVINRNNVPRSGLKYSPYAFSFDNPSGLVSEDARYSPYVFSFDNPSGLVSNDARYSPYAFDHKSSGLVVDKKEHGAKRYVTGNRSGVREVSEAQVVGKRKPVRGVEEGNKKVIVDYLRGAGVGKIFPRSSFFQKGETVSASIYLPEKKIYLIYVSPESYGGLDDKGKKVMKVYFDKWRSDIQNLSIEKLVVIDESFKENILKELESTIGK
ncbi:MAG: hypothetical protein KJ592_02435 [Nanoarchaeota archaeon]|nr:hypothetical protein [Nanoarchaeota archaeon]